MPSSWVKDALRDNPNKDSICNSEIGLSGIVEAIKNLIQMVLFVDISDFPSISGSKRNRTQN